MNENATEIRRGSVEGVLQRCGICSLLSSLLRRAMCVGSRRGSGESYYQELPEVVPDKTIMEPKKSAYNIFPDPFSNKRVSLSSQDRILFDALIAEENSLSPKKRHYSNGRFLTMHKRRRKKLQTRSLAIEPAVLDDILHGQVACILKQVGNWRFNAFSLENVTGGRSLSVLCVHLFYSYGLMSHFNLDAVRLWKLFNLIEEGYHSSNPYHNSIHATDVTQAMHCFLQEKRILEHLEPLEIMASLLGAVCHDLDHPGVNQPFLIATSNHLAALYENTSVLENHHWRSAIGCLLDSGVAEQIETIRPELEKQISSLILATDITRQQEFIGIFKDFLNNNTLNMRNSSHRHFILQIALKCADISNPCRPWDVSKKWSLKVCEEFFRQGDFERQLNLPVTSLCDRFSTTVPKIQTGFFKFVVSPLMIEWHRFLKTDLSYRMMRHLRYNEKQWDTRLQAELAEETRTEISDAEVLDDDIDDKNGSDEVDDYSSQRFAGSPEMTLPEIKSSRRSSLQIPTYSLKDKDRRLSVPLHSVPKIILPNKDPSRAPEALLESDENEHCSLSILSSDSESGHIARSSIDSNDNERPLSAENLLPDLNIASMTDSICADKLNIVMHGSTNFPSHMLNVSTSKHLIRQHTFPPLQPCVRTRYMSSTAELGTYPEALLESRSGSSSESLDNFKTYCQARYELKRDFEQDSGKKEYKMPKLCETGQKENLDPKLNRKHQSFFSYRRGSAPMSSTTPAWKPIGHDSCSSQNSSENSRRCSVPVDNLGIKDNAVSATIKSTDALISSTGGNNNPCTARRSSLTFEANLCKTLSNGKRQNNRKFLRRKSSGGFENLTENLISKVGSASTSFLLNSSSSRFKTFRGTDTDSILQNAKRRGSLPIEALTIGVGTFRH